MFNEFTKKESPFFTALGYGGGNAGRLIQLLDGSYVIDRSVRFVNSDSSYLKRTPSSAGNRRTFTYSCWVKRSTLGSSLMRRFFSAGSTSTSTGNVTLAFYQDNIFFQIESSSARLISTSKFRDISAWYHIVVSVDTTQSTSSNRVKIYVNGVQLTSFSTTGYPSQNKDTSVNNTEQQLVGCGADSGGNVPDGAFDGYITECHLVDGQALDPTEFGAFDDNNVWQAKEYTGTYGTNGFKLNFSDTSSNAALGYDTSGNSNNFTVYNLIASSSNDQNISSVSFVGNANAGNQVRVFKLNSDTVVTSSVYASAQNNISQYDSGQNSNFFPNAHDGDESTNLDWKFGNIAYTFNSKSASYIEYVGTISSGGSVQINGNTYNAPHPQYGVTSGGYPIRRVYLVTPRTVDGVFDSPTNDSDDDTGTGGEISGLYATLNALDRHNLSNDTVSNGNLEASFSGGSACVIPSTLAFSSGKFYYEFEPGIVGDIGNGVCGIRKANSRNYDNSYVYLGDGRKIIDGATAASYGDSYTNGDTIGCAVDMDNGTIRWYKNGVDQGQAYTGISGLYCFFQGTFGGSSSGTYAVNYGQRPFAQTAPSGFKALTSTNLTATIGDGSKYFDTKLWDGTGSARSITMDNSSMSPDFVWIKERGVAGGHNLYDSVRGATKFLASEDNNTEGTDSSALTSFNSDGFSLGTGFTVKSSNKSGRTYAGWCWDAGSSTVSNSDGSITSNVRANQEAGFSIVTYTGLGGTQTIGHGLNAVPEMILCKNRNFQNSWSMYHVDIGNTNTISINSTNAPPGSNSAYWNNTTPTNSVFSVGSSDQMNGGSGHTYVAYCFAPIEGYSIIGKYTGNGSSTDGRHVYCGFRPKFILIRGLANNRGWLIYDTERDTINPNDNNLFPNTNGAENSDSSHNIDILSNGFKAYTSSANRNASSENYIFYAVAESPLQGNGGIAYR
tara:strand:+ start:5756 stop:8608 length:2853 start_codon:yes stop_codon:yes gene_type:complete